MLIGINAAAAIKQPRTGVEEYTYQVIKHLTMLPQAEEHHFLLYLPAVALAKAGLPFDFSLPKNFEIKKLSWCLPMWTQLRLASHLFFDKPDILFIPVHILPMVHPKNSVVTIHGLEYEYFPECYPLWFRNYLRLSTRYALKHARKIIAVSENTKMDLIKFYGADESKIAVVHHGVEMQNAKIPPKARLAKGGKNQKENAKSKIKKPYLLYIGRIEVKKNILGILEAYKILKEKYRIPHELVLAGAPGFGYDKIKFKIQDSKFKINELGFVSEDEKQQLLANADVFIFPSLYEGFGMPVLEAQTSGVPVVSSNGSSIPEVTGESSVLIDSTNHQQIAGAVHMLIDDKAFHDKLIELGFENIKRFSWEKCARETLQVLTEK